MMDLPLYQCVKRARACKIKSIERDEQGYLIHAYEKHLDPISVPFEFVERNSPRPGHYLLQYENGLYGCATARDFEANWLEMDHMQDRRDQLTRQLADVNAAIAAHERQTHEGP